jgi:hypothetical protein
MEELEKKINKVGSYNYSEDELKLEAATFADGSRIVPRISLQSSKRYISWRDNDITSNTDYPIKILELYNNSAIHHAIIDMKAEALAGGGLEVVDPNHPKAAETIAFINKKNPDGIDCNESNKRLALDYEIFNGLTGQFVFRKDWLKIEYVKHLELNKIRIQTPDASGNTNGYFWAMDWSLYRPTKMLYVEKFNKDLAMLKGTQYQGIENKWLKENKEADLQLLKKFIDMGNTMVYYHKCYHPNSYWYPIPSYIGVIPSLEIDIQSDMNANASLRNGMDNGISITILGDASSRESQLTAKRLLKSYGGARNAGKPLIIFTEDLDTAPVIKEIGGNNNIARKYQVINDSTQSKILTGHRIPNAGMLGIETPGKLGNTSADDKKAAEETFYNKYIKPRQKVLEDFWNEVMEFNGLAPVRVIDNNVFNQAKIESGKAGLDVSGGTNNESGSQTPQNAPTIKPESSGIITPHAPIPNASVQKGNNLTKNLLNIFKIK